MGGGVGVGEGGHNWLKHAVITIKGGATNIKVGSNALEGGGGVNTVKTLKIEKGAWPLQLLWWRRPVY